MNFFSEPTFQQAGFGFLSAFLILSIVAVALLIRDKRAEVAKAKRASLVRAIAAHPAGKGRPPVHSGWLAERPLPVEPTRHIDRAGFDWTK